MNLFYLSSLLKMIEKESARAVQRRRKEVEGEASSKKEQMPAKRKIPNAKSSIKIKPPI